MRSSTAVGLAAARGKFTSIPRYIIGAVSMKMRSRTSTTSTSGMMLISASAAPPLRASDESTLNAIADRHAIHRALGERPAEEIQEVEREAVHLGRPAPH